MFMFKKIILGLCLFMGGIMFTYKVLIPIGDYFKEPGVPPLVGDPKIPNYMIVVTYQYWNDVKHNWYNEEEVTRFVENEIIKETNDMRLVNLYREKKKSQNISIQKNKANNNIYFFTNPREHISKLTIYEDDGEQLKEKKQIVIAHPTYKVGYGMYDETNNKIYLGVIRKNFTEGDFGGEWISGNAVIDLNE